MTMSRLDEFPGIHVDAEPIARGLFAMMDDDEQDLIRLGLLPHRWIELLEKQTELEMREKLGFPTGDTFTYWMKDKVVEDQSMKKLVSAIVHEVCLKLYGCVKMVV